MSTYDFTATFLVPLGRILSLYAPIEARTRNSRCRKNLARLAPEGISVSQNRAAVASIWTQPSSRYCASALFPLCLLVTCLGFLIYWGLPLPPAAIVGLFVLGLGVALLYPLTLGLAMGAAGTRADTASARAALAGSFGILVTPALLGRLADKVGLHLAHLIVPGLVVVALICFVTAQALQRQTRLYQSG